ncbi:hypothetical protein JOE11_004441 [Robbsia andropogonis]
MGRRPCGVAWRRTHGCDDRAGLIDMRGNATHVIVFAVFRKNDGARAYTM